jgi:hypothetical protein
MARSLDGPPIFGTGASSLEIGDNVLFGETFGGIDTNEDGKHQVRALRHLL